MTDAVPTHMPTPAPTATLAVAPAPTALLATAAVSTKALSAEELKLLPQTAGHATPTIAAAGVAVQAAAAAATTWQSQKTVVGQWTINQDRNSWMSVAGIGWQKLSTASDSGCVALTMLASSALITKAAVSYRQESDGMVHEMYVF